MNAQKDWTSAGYTRCSEDPSSVNYNRWWADHGSYFKNLEYAAPPEGGDQKWLCRLSAYRLWADEVTAQEGVDLQTKMEQRAAAVLADIFAAMPKDPTLEELDVELSSAIYALYHVDGKHNAMRPKDAPRMHLRPTGLLLKALTNQFHKDDAGDAEAKAIDYHNRNCTEGFALIDGVQYLVSTSIQKILQGDEFNDRKFVSLLCEVGIVDGQKRVADGQRECLISLGGLGTISGQFQITNIQEKPLFDSSIKQIVRLDSICVVDVEVGE